jgi:hypothetical protein
MHNRKMNSMDWLRRPTPVSVRAALTSVIALGALLAIGPQPVFAAAEVQGRLDDMQVQAENATVGEVLNALSGKFKFSYKLSPNLTRPITGTYVGPFRQVLGRVLDGHDYIVNDSDAGIELVVLGASNPLAVSPITANNNEGNAVRVTPAAVAEPAAQPVAAVSAAPPSDVPPLTSFLSVN